MRYNHNGYQFDVGAVSVASDSKERIRSPRDRPYIMRRTMVMEGEVKGATQSSIRQQLLSMAGFFTTDAAFSGLYHDDGSPSAHYMSSANSLTPIRVLKPPSFTDGQPAQYATYRSFSFMVQADFAAIDADPLYDFNETIQYKGNCGPRKVQVELDTGPPDEQIVSQQTVQYISQSGIAVGIGSYPSAPAAIYPALVQNPDVGWSYSTPRPQGYYDFTLYPIRWQYTMASDVPLNGTPTAR